MSDNYQHNRTRAKYNYPAGADVTGMIENIGSLMINDNTYTTELAGAFGNATGVFGTITTRNLLIPDMTGMAATGSIHLDGSGALNVYNGSTWLRYLPS